MHIFISPIRAYAKAVQYDCSPWLFVYLLGDMFFLIIFLSGIVYYYANVPFLHKESMYQIIRSGRTRWAVIQLTTMLLGAIAITGIVVLFSLILLFPQIEWSSGWGKILYTLALTDAGEQHSVSLQIPYDIIKSFTPLKIVSVTIPICFLTIWLIGNLMFCLSLWTSRIIAITVAFLGIVSIIMEQNMYLFPNMFLMTPLGWLQTTKWTNVGLSGHTIIIALLLLNIVMMGASVIKIRIVNLRWSDEEV